MRSLELAEERLVDPDRLAKGLTGILDSCANKEISPAVALLKLISISGNEAGLAEGMKLAVEEAASRNNAALAEICALYVENRPRCERALTMSKPEVLTESMPADARIARLRQTFDRWVEEDAALSVAAYTFGNPRLMQRATQEVIDVLDKWELLGSDVDALQIGCGTGRFEALLGPKVRSAWGIDISGKMIEAARQRITGLENLWFSQCSGRDLAPFEANSFDLIYAVDTFPYIVQGGAELVGRYFAEVARVLGDSGHFVIFQYSYRSDAARDHDEIRRLAAAHNYSVVREGVTPFTIWDGVGYHLRRDPG